MAIPAIKEFLADFPFLPLFATIFFTKKKMISVTFEKKLQKIAFSSWLKWNERKN